MSKHCFNCGLTLEESDDLEKMLSKAEHDSKHSWYIIENGWIEFFEDPDNVPEAGDNPGILYLCPNCLKTLFDELNSKKT